MPRRVGVGAAAVAPSWNLAPWKDLPPGPPRFFVDSAVGCYVVMAPPWVQNLPFLAPDEFILFPRVAENHVNSTLVTQLIDPVK